MKFFKFGEEEFNRGGYSRRETIVSKFEALKLCALGYFDKRWVVLDSQVADETRHYRPCLERLVIFSKHEFSKSVKSTTIQPRMRHERTDGESFGVAGQIVDDPVRELLRKCGHGNLFNVSRGDV